MALNIYSNSGKISYNIKELISDTFGDLPLEGVGIGSTAYVVEDEKHYMFNSLGQWIEISIGTGGGGSGKGISIITLAEGEYDAETGKPIILGAKENTIYLAPNPKEEESDLYIEWISVNGEWEKFGSAAIDLDGYLLKNNPVASGSFTLGIRGTYGDPEIGENSFTSGLGNVASGQASHASGLSTKATGQAANAEGLGTTASGSGAHAEGAGTTAEKQGSHSEGTGTKATEEGAHAEGIETKAFGVASHSEGVGTNANEKGAHAEGAGTKAQSKYSHAEGADTTASGQAAHAEGANTTASGLESHAEGYGTIAAAPNAHTEGSRTEVTQSAANAHAEGADTKATASQAHAEGSSTIASGPNSHAEGDQTKAVNNGAHSEGYKTLANANASHAEGSETKALSIYSHAEGQSTTASGASSHAEGAGTTASGAQSHAEGQDTVAEGTNSHAEGQNTVASKIGAHAEGSGSYAVADYAHAEGKGAYATNEAAHAEGISTSANGKASHAEGEGTTASSMYQHVQGKYNIIDNNNQYADIVGNGTSANRSNAYTLDWNGNAYFAGNITYTNKNGIIVSLSDGMEYNYVDLNKYKSGWDLSYDNSHITTYISPIGDDIKNIALKFEITNIQSYGLAGVLIGFGEASEDSERLNRFNGAGLFYNNNNISFGMNWAEATAACTYTEEDRIGFEFIKMGSDYCLKVYKNDELVGKKTYENQMVPGITDSMITFAKALVLTAVGDKPIENPTYEAVYSYERKE